MFQSCKLHLAQAPSNGPSRWLQIVLFNPKVPQVANGQSLIDYMMSAQKYPWRGSVRTGGNSFNQRADGYYALGNTWAEGRFWRWSPKDGGVLEFIDRVMRPGANAATGEDVEIAEVVAELHGASLSQRGVRPIASSGKGRGVVRVETHIFRAGFPLTWEWAVGD